MGYPADFEAQKASNLTSCALIARHITARKKRKNQVPTYAPVLVGFHEFEKSSVDRFSVLKAIFMVDIEVVDVIAIPDAVVVAVVICMAGKTNGIMSFQSSIKSTEGDVHRGSSNIDLERAYREEEASNI